MSIEKLYRAISLAEYEDWKKHQTFRTAVNTLEAKQFFKSREAVNFFVKQSSVIFAPPYLIILEVYIDRNCLMKLGVDSIELDTHAAISVEEGLLPGFNHCIIFTKTYDI